jgi:hypothetical protein
MDNYGKNRKKYVFYEDDHTYAQFRIKLFEDGVKQSAFFKNIIKSYLQNDPNIRAWLESQPDCKISERAKRIRRREIKEADKELAKFNIEGIDVNELFDIIASEEKDDE